MDTFAEKEREGYGFVGQIECIRNARRDRRWWVNCEGPLVISSLRVGSRVLWVIKWQFFPEDRVVSLESMEMVQLGALHAGIMVCIHYRGVYGSKKDSWGA